MSYLVGSGWWVLWYGLLWLSLTPFVAMTAALARATPNDPMPAMETAFAIGSVGLFVLMVRDGDLRLPVDRRRVVDWRVAVHPEHWRRRSARAHRRDSRSSSARATTRSRRSNPCSTVGRRSSSASRRRRCARPLPARDVAVSSPVTLAQRHARRDSISLGEARRIALAAQGFDRPRPAGPVNAGHLRRVIRQIGLMQIDSVNVLLPAHYQVPFSRLGPYDRARLDALIYKRPRVHRAVGTRGVHPARSSIGRSFGITSVRTNAAGGRSRSSWTATPDYAARVLEEVRARGPVVAGEIDEPDGTRGTGGGWWGWTMAKATLEGHFSRGNDRDRRAADGRLRARVRSGRARRA